MGQEGVDLFERHTDVEPFFAPEVERHEAVSATCPEIQGLAEGLQPLTLRLKSDGSLSELDAPPPPHGSSTIVELHAKFGNGGKVTMTGSRPLYPIMQPLWNAAERCSPPSYAAQLKAG